MGYAYCGERKDGEQVGYAVQAKCDHDGCETKIERGMGYACGFNHFEDEFSCEGYFCVEHAFNHVINPPAPPRVCTVCDSCFERLKKEALKYDDGLEYNKERNEIHWKT